MQNLYKLFVIGNQKAITAFVLSAAAVWLAVVGISLEMTVGDALKILLTGAINGVGVWFKANK